MLVDFLSLLFPELCVGCDAPLVKGEDQLCTSCMLKLPYTHFYQETKNPVWKRFLGKVHLRYAHSFLFFVKEGIVQNMLHALKYKGNEDIGFLLGVWYGHQLKGSAMAEVDVIIPVPMHRKKKRKRGYNQVDSFASGLSQALGAPWTDTILMKTDNTESQTRKGRFDRWQNVAEVFVLMQPKEIEGKRVLLVDDVVTTGSTLESCIVILQDGQPTSIDVATIACAT